MNSQIPPAKLEEQSQNLEFKLYFLQGCDNRQISKTHYKEFMEYTRINPYGHSFFIYNPKVLCQKINLWQETLPWITPYYAIKSNPSEPLLKDLINSPFGNFDCASKKVSPQIIKEIKLVLKQGVPGSKIVYSNPVKEEKDILFASSRGVQITTADSIDELRKIKRIAPDMKILWRISIVEENPEKNANLFSGKFGDDIPNLDAAHKRFKQIQDIGIQLYGIHFHCGSGIQGSTSFGKAVDLAKDCMKIGRQYGHLMELLDVGGGFPSGEFNENSINALKKTENDPLGYQVIAEPGRFFSANSCSLLFRIMAKKYKNEKLCYHVNESVYHSFNCTMMDGISFENDQKQFYDVIDSADAACSIGKQENCSLFGMTCCGGDIIAKNIKMPTDLNVGDWLCMSGMGAYTIGPKSSFNGMKATTRVYTLNGQVEKELQQNLIS